MSRTRNTFLAVVAVLLSPLAANADLITNGSFEAAGTGWGTSSTVSPFCTFPAVVGAGVTCWPTLFATAPTDGNFVAHHGFDGSGPGRIDIFQDIAATPEGGALTLEFDWRAGWDLRLGAQATAARLLEVIIQPFGGGAAISTFNILTTPTGNSFVPDTGAMTSVLNLSAFAGTSFRLNFSTFIPEAFTGPGHLQLDNVRLTRVPEPTTLALLGVGLVGFGLARRRRKA